MSDEEVVTYPIDDVLAALEHIDFVVRAMSHIVFVHLSEARSHWCLELRAIGSSARERSTQCTLIVAVQRKRRFDPTFRVEFGSVSLRSDLDLDR